MINSKPLAHLNFIGISVLFTIEIGLAKPAILNLSIYPSKIKQILVALVDSASSFFLALFFGVILGFYFYYVFKYFLIINSLLSF